MEISVENEQVSFNCAIMPTTKTMKKNPAVIVNCDGSGKKGVKLPKSKIRKSSMVFMRTATWPVDVWVRENKVHISAIEMCPDRVTWKIFLPKNLHKKFL